LSPIAQTPLLTHLTKIYLNTLFQVEERFDGIAMPRDRSAVLFVTESERRSPARHGKLVAESWCTVRS
jgi:hypothetical protein